MKKKFKPKNQVEIEYPNSLFSIFLKPFELMPMLLYQFAF